MTDELPTLSEELESDDFNLETYDTRVLRSLDKNSVKELICFAGGEDGKEIPYFGQLSGRFKLMGTKQLLAMKLLARTGHPKAYRYLMRLTEYKQWILWDGATYGQSGSDQIIGSRGKYPHLHGDLGIRIGSWDNTEGVTDSGTLWNGPYKGNDVSDDASDFPHHELSIITDAQKKIAETTKERFPLLFAVNKYVIRPVRSHFVNYW